MASRSQIESGNELLANTLDRGLRHGNFVSGSNQAISNYNASGDARQIVNNGMITIEKLTNNYAGSSTGSHSEHEALLVWLIGSKDNVQQQMAINIKALDSRQKRSGEWLWKVAAFKNWLDGRSRMIWLHGGVGCGKTVLATTVAQQACEALDTDTSNVLQYYCSIRYASGQDFDFMLRILLAKMCLQQVPDAVKMLYSDCQERNQWRAIGAEANRPSTPALRSVFRQTLIAYHDFLRQRTSLTYPEKRNFEASAVHRIFIIVDGVDELDRLEIIPALDFLNSLVDLSFVRIMVSSRTQFNIEDTLLRLYTWPAVSVDKVLVRDDIAAYIDTQIRTSELRRLPEQVRAEIAATLLTRGDGMFLWVSLQLDHLKTVEIDDIQFIREELKTLPNDVHETYTRIIERIPVSVRSKVRRALRWLALTRRPLFLDELTEVCNLSDDLHQVPELIEPKFLMSADLSRSLSSLVYFDHSGTAKKANTPVVTLAHASVQDFLVENLGDHSSQNHPQSTIAIMHSGSIRDADQSLAQICLAYLYCYNRPSTCRPDRTFLQYAWFHWEEHLHAIQPDKQVQNYFRSQVSTAFDEIERDPTTLVPWLPTKGKCDLLDALSVPYFHTQIDEFQLDARKGESRATYSLDRRDERSDGRILQELQHPTLQIRLLEILPSASARGPTLGRLQAFTLALAPVYDAVSYVSSPHDQRGSTVRINGVETYVMPNLYSILRNLRMRSEQEEGLLWIDALSIDQMNAKERTGQVQILPNIFSSARRVLVSFGEVEPRDAIGVANFIDVGKCLIAKSKEPDTLRDILRDPGSCITTLFSKTFWSRLWIIQEITLAKDLMVLFGSQSLSLRDLQLCMPLLHQSHQKIRQRHEMHDTKDEFRSILRIMNTRREFLTHGKCDLFDLLMRFKYQHCSIEVDRIFSLYGLCSGDGPDISMNYATPPRQMFMETTLAIMIQDRSLRVLSYHPVRQDILSEHYFRRANEDFSPSWSLKQDNHFLKEEESAPISLLYENQGAFSAGGSAFDARRLTEMFDVANARIRESCLQRPVLRLEGYAVAEIVELFEIDPSARSPGEQLDMLDRIEAAQIRLGSSWSTDGLRSRFNRLWTRTSHLTRRTTGRSPCHEDSNAESAGDATTTEVRWRTMLADQMPSVKRLENAMAEHDIPPTTREMEMELISSYELHEICPYLRGRVVSAITGLDKDLHGISLCPETSAIGDFIVILKGGSVPFVLRMTDYGDYVLLGECYVHGIMNGEILSDPAFHPRNFNLI